MSSQHQKICWLIEQARLLDANQLELQSHWARYICVVSSGFLENALKEIFSNYARSCSSPPIADFVESKLSGIQNPKSNRFVETAGTFNKDWAINLEAFLAIEGRKEAIDGIMSNRHLIAHGKDSGITLAGIKEYLRKSVSVIEHLEQQCGIGNRDSGTDSQGKPAAPSRRNPPR